MAEEEDILDELEGAEAKKPIGMIIGIMPMGFFASAPSSSSNASSSSAITRSPAPY